MLWRQVILAHGSPTNRIVTTGWMRDQRVKIGTQLTLKHDPDTVRTVINVSDIALNEPPLKEWKVGGLF